MNDKPNVNDKPNGAGDIAGTPIRFAFGGRSYVAEQPTVVHLGRMEDAIADASYEEAEGMAARAVSPAAKERAAHALERVHRSVIEEHAHKVGNRLWTSAMSNPTEFAVYVLWSCLVPPVGEERMSVAAVRKMIGSAGENPGFTRAIAGVLDFFAVALSEAMGRTLPEELKGIVTRKLDAMESDPSRTRGTES